MKMKICPPADGCNGCKMTSAEKACDPLKQVGFHYLPRQEQQGSTGYFTRLGTAECVVLGRYILVPTTYLPTFYLSLSLSAAAYGTILDF